VATGRNERDVKDWLAQSLFCRDPTGYEEYGMSPRIGLITSRASERLLASSKVVPVETPFGMASLLFGSISGKEVAAINRYGQDLTTPSHKINFRSNLWALRSVGVERLISQNAIGSVNPLIPPGKIVIPNDFLDRTSQRPRSFFDEMEAWVRVDMTIPFCPELRQALSEGVSSVSPRLVDGGVFACVEGPRLETPAEVSSLRQQGADIVGTPLVPEVVLAREAEICFASIAPVINFAAGITEAVSHTGMNAFYYSSGLHEVVEDAIARAVLDVPDRRSCACANSLADAYVGERPAWLDDWTVDE
jgi:5'-methylthioadenosine phosphorylase